MITYKCPRCGFTFDSDTVVAMHCPCGDEQGEAILMEVQEAPEPDAGQHTTLAGAA